MIFNYIIRIYIKLNQNTFRILNYLIKNDNELYISIYIKIISINKSKYPSDIFGVITFEGGLD